MHTRQADSTNWEFDTTTNTSVLSHGRVLATILAIGGLGCGCAIYPCSTELEDAVLRSLPVLPLVTFHHDDRTTAAAGVCIAKNKVATTPHGVLIDGDIHAVADVGARVIAQAQHGAMWDDWAVKWAPDICEDEWVDVLDPATVLPAWRKFWIVGMEPMAMDKAREADEQIEEYLASERTVVLPCLVVPRWFVLRKADHGFSTNVVQAMTSYGGPFPGLSGSVAVVWDAERERYQAFGLLVGEQPTTLGRVLVIRRLNFVY